MTEEEWDEISFEQILDMAKDPNAEGIDELPSFVRAQLPRLTACQDKRERRKRAKMLVYAFFLILYNQLPSRYLAALVLCLIFDTCMDRDKYLVKLHERMACVSMNTTYIHTKLC
jgi:hypothetical protein